MLNEVGSNFWAYSLAKTNRVQKLWWESAEYHHVFFQSGRSAIKALAHMLWERPARVLLPVYTCETVVQPFLDEGWEIDYYLMNHDLSINTQSLLEKSDCFSPTAILIHGYFGFPTFCNAFEVIKLLHERGIIVIEDITQSIFSSHHIQCADYYVSSLRKFLAIPDGGVVFSRNELDFGDIAPAEDALAKVAFSAFELKRKYMEQVQSEELKLQFREQYQTLNQMIADYQELKGISPVSKRIFQSCDIERIRIKRVENYTQLLIAVKGVEYIQPVIQLPTENVSPLYLPVYVRTDRGALQSYLAEHRVYCPVIWPKPPQVNTDDAVTNNMYAHMLCFPIDQRYGSEEMDHIATLLQEYIQKKA